MAAERAAVTLGDRQDTPAANCFALATKKGHLLSRRRPSTFVRKLPLLIPSRRHRHLWVG